MTDAQLDEIYDAAYDNVLAGRMQNRRSMKAHWAGLHAVAVAVEGEVRRLIGADLRNGSYDAAAYPHFGCEDAIAEWIDPKETTDG